MKYFFVFILLTSNLWAESLELAQRKYPQEHKEIVELIENEDFLESDEYSDELKEIYFNAFVNKLEEFKRTEKSDHEIPLLLNILEGLEYKEDEVASLVESFEKRQKHIIAKRWVKDFDLGISFTSFQRHIDLESPSDKQKLINTTKASCFGGGLNIKNQYWSLTTHGCFMIGNSNIKEREGSPQYKESSVPLWGIKVSQRMGKIVSSTRSELGISLPVIYYNQDLKNPSGSYKVKDDKSFIVAPAIYGRWALGKLVFDTEIGQFLDQSNTYYSLSFGVKF
ncbi:MAG: hypothetical protein WCY48_10725 [Candidatus Caldatribacteriota bacterium]